MSILTTAARHDLSPERFGLPGERAYPMPDRAHAQNALSRASEEFNRGNLTGSQKAMIDRKANALLGR